MSINTKILIFVIFILIITICTVYGQNDFGFPNIKMHESKWSDRLYRIVSYAGSSAQKMASGSVIVQTKISAGRILLEMKEIFYVSPSEKFIAARFKKFINTEKKTIFYEGLLCDDEEVKKNIVMKEGDEVRMRCRVKAKPDIIDGHIPCKGYLFDNFGNNPFSLIVYNVDENICSKTTFGGYKKNFGFYEEKERKILGLKEKKICDDSNEFLTRNELIIISSFGAEGIYKMFDQIARETSGLNDMYKPADIVKGYLMSGNFDEIRYAKEIHEEFNDF